MTDPVFFNRPQTLSEEQVKDALTKHEKQRAQREALDEQIMQTRRMKELEEAIRKKGGGGGGKRTSATARNSADLTDDTGLYGVGLAIKNPRNNGGKGANRQHQNEISGGGGGADVYGIDGSGSGESRHRTYAVNNTSSSAMPPNHAMRISDGNTVARRGGTPQNNALQLPSGKSLFAERDLELLGNQYAHRISDASGGFRRDSYETPSHLNRGNRNRLKPLDENVLQLELDSAEPSPAEYVPEGPAGQLPRFGVVKDRRSVSPQDRRNNQQQQQQPQQRQQQRTLARQEEGKGGQDHGAKKKQDARQSPGVKANGRRPSQQKQRYPSRGRSPRQILVNEKVHGKRVRGSGDRRVDDRWEDDAENNTSIMSISLSELRDAHEAAHDMFGDGVKFGNPRGGANGARHGKADARRNSPAQDRRRTGRSSRSTGDRVSSAGLTPPQSSEDTPHSGRGVRGRGSDFLAAGAGGGRGPSKARDAKGKKAVDGRQGNAASPAPKTTATGARAANVAQNRLQKLQKELDDRQQEMQIMREKEREFEDQVKQLKAELRDARRKEVDLHKLVGNGPQRAETAPTQPNGASMSEKTRQKNADVRNEGGNSADRVIRKRANPKQDADVRKPTKNLPGHRSKANTRFDRSTGGTLGRTAEGWVEEDEGSYEGTGQDESDSREISVGTTTNRSRKQDQERTATPQETAILVGTHREKGNAARDKKATRDIANTNYEYANGDAYGMEEEEYEYEGASYPDGTPYGDIDSFALMSVAIGYEHLLEFVTAEVITRRQAEDLWAFLCEESEEDAQRAQNQNDRLLPNNKPISESLHRALHETTTVRNNGVKEPLPVVPLSLLHSEVPLDEPAEENSTHVVPSPHAPPPPPAPPAQPEANLAKVPPTTIPKNGTKKKNSVNVKKASDSLASGATDAAVIVQPAARVITRADEVTLEERILSKVKDTMGSVLAAEEQHNYAGTKEDAYPTETNSASASQELNDEVSGAINSIHILNDSDGVQVAQEDEMEDETEDYTNDRGTLQSKDIESYHDDEEEEEDDLLADNREENDDEEEDDEGEDQQEDDEEDEDEGEEEEEDLPEAKNSVEVESIHDDEDEL